MGSSTVLLRAQSSDTDSLTWGVEYDFMAPRIGQWYDLNINGYVAQGRIKHSLMFAHINIKEIHLTDESFSKDNLTAFGYRGEIFSHKDLKRWSAGVLLLYSRHHVETVASHQQGSFGTLFVGVPLGYTWVLWKHLTINPGINVLYPITNRTVTIGTEQVAQAPWGLEPGLRVGYRF